MLFNTLLSTIFQLYGGTDCIGSYKSNYHKIRATTNPNFKDQAVFASENINQQKNSYTRHQHGS